MFVCLFVWRGPATIWSAELERKVSYPQRPFLRPANSRSIVSVKNCRSALRNPATSGLSQRTGMLSLRPLLYLPPSRKIAQEDTREECAKFGEVLAVFIPRPHPPRFGAQAGRRRPAQRRVLFSTRADGTRRRRRRLGLHRAAAVSCPSARSGARRCPMAVGGRPTPRGLRLLNGGGAR